MYRQYEQEQQEADERGVQAEVNPYTDKEASYDEQNMDNVNMSMNMQMPYDNVMSTGIKMNIGGRPMMCYPIVDEDPTSNEDNLAPYEGMQNMGCPAMHQYSDMYRQPSHYYPNYPMTPFFPYTWHNFYPYHMPYPPHHPYNYREDWY